MPGRRDRSIVFIDGSNWFHGLVEIGVLRKFALNYAKLSTKLIGPARDWVGTRYYIGRLDVTSSAYADQRRLESFLKNTDPRIAIHFGRVERRMVKNEAASEILTYLHTLKMKIDERTFQDLVAFAKKHEKAFVWQEKAVDVQLAVDMVVMATRDEYDVAYLLSADGDFTGAVSYVRSLGKKVYAASPLRGAQIAKVVNSFIPLTDPRWFDDCY